MRDIPRLRPVDAGRLANGAFLESLTALELDLNRISDDGSLVFRETEILDGELVNDRVEFEDRGVEAMGDHGGWSGAYP